MDDRLQSGIREGAGREESRYNLEFIDFLQKWGTPALLVACIAAGGFAAYRHFSKLRTEKLDAAFVEYEGAATGGSPESLAAIADQYQGIASVSMLARLDAAEAYRRAILTGVKPGAVVEKDGSVKDANDLMSDADRAEFLGKAEALYNQVLEESSKDQDKAWFSVSARFGLAAVEESRGAMDKARAQYTEIASMCEGTALGAQAIVAKKRIERLPELEKLPKMLTRAEVPVNTPTTPPPAPTPAPTAVPAPGPEGPAPQPAPAGPVTPPAQPAEQPKPEAPK